MNFVVKVTLYSISKLCGIKNIVKRIKNNFKKKINFSPQTKKNKRKYG